jgi:N-acetylglucosaminyldiphosphoundecaprenol N-acetyl-beta-D-mannosaminyltransferase
VNPERSPLAGRVETYRILDVRVHALTTSLTIEVVRELVSQRRSGYLVFCTVSSILSARDDPAVAQTLEKATLVTPDGMPLVWVGRRRGHRVERVYGPDFMVDLFAATGGEMTHFFYGGARGVAEEMAEALQRRHPDLRVSGTLSPPARLDPQHPPGKDIDTINGSGADVVWVGLGHPKQDLFMFHNRDRVAAPVMAGVGAAFDFHSGRKKEAPGWMKRSGLQWLHRLGSEPRRLWRRYLIGNTRFVWLLARDARQRKRRA